MPRVAALLETLLSMLQMLILLLLEKKRRKPRTIPGESAEGTGPSAALRTQRETLASLGSHHPSVGLIPNGFCRIQKFISIMD